MPEVPVQTLAGLAAAKGLDPAWLAELGLADLPRGGIALPYYGFTGEHLFTRQRDNGRSRFYQPAGVPLQPYGLHRIAEARRLGLLYILEGESDCWPLWLCGLPALGLPGADSSKCLTAEALDGIQGAYVWEEPNAAGAKFVKGVRERLLGLGYEGRLHVIAIPGVKDPADLWAANPERAAFLAAIADAVEKARTALPEPAKPHEMNGDSAAVGAVEPIRHNSAESGKPLRGWADGEEIIYPASEVEPKEIEWLWPWRIPLSKLTTFAGLAGLGKTFVLCDIAARVASGLPWPDAPGAPAEAGQVLYISGEDDPDDTLVPRMIELGADLSRIVFLKTAVEDSFSLADLDTLSEALKQANRREGMPAVRFIAIDPPTAFLGDKNDHKNAELRGLLRPLKSWAKEWRCAITFNTHFNKASGQKIEAMMRVIGGVAWVNAVRAAHAFAVDPQDPDRRLFVPMKNNLGPRRPGLSYRLSFEPGRMARVEWLGEVDTTADDAVNSTRSHQPRGVVASEWLIGKFRERLEWASADLFRAAKEEGVSRSAIFEAKTRLDLPKARKISGMDGDSAWVWWVPADWPHLAETEEAAQIGEFDEEPSSPFR